VYRAPVLIAGAYLLEELARLGAAFARTGLGPGEVAEITRRGGSAIDTDGQASLFRLLPVWDETQARHYLWSSRAALVAGAAHSAHLRSGGVVPHLVHDGDYRVDGPEQRVVCASLEIRGRLLLADGARLVVIGDLYATDSLEIGPRGDYDGYYAHLACGGDVRVAGLVSTGGWYVVAGSLHAAVALAYYNHGALVVAGDLNAQVLYERDHGPSIVCGRTTAATALVDSMLDRDPDDALNTLLNMVRPDLRQRLRDAFEEDAEEDGLDEMERLLRHHALARTLLA
jgi:hypothetical protein